MLSNLTIFLLLQLCSTRLRHPQCPPSPLSSLWDDRSPGSDPWQGLGAISDIGIVFAAIAEQMKTSVPAQEQFKSEKEESEQGNEGEDQGPRN